MGNRGGELSSVKPCEPEFLRVFDFFEFRSQIGELPHVFEEGSRDKR